MKLNDSNARGGVPQGNNCQQAGYDGGARGWRDTFE
jgi:hypothetical protein